MDIYKPVFNFFPNYRTLLWEVESILGDETLKFNDWWRVFEKRRGLSFNAIKKKLKDKEIEFNDKELNLILQLLVSNYKMVVRNEYWSKETEYELLDRRFWEHKSQYYHYSFEDNIKSKKIFLLISDTHIGNDKMFNSKLMNNLYDYAIMMGAKKCFHLGDLFEGDYTLFGMLPEYDVSLKYVNDFEEEFCRQMNLFINEYPKPNPDEFMTYCLIGNHDEIMNRFLQFRDCLSSCDLRKLTMYNPSFYMFPRTSWCANLNNIDFHFNHRLYMSVIIENLKINKLEDIEKKKEQVGDLIFDTNYDVLVSGHLHKGIIYTETDYFKEKDKLYLGVPSTGNVNIGGVVGYLTYIYPESNTMEISILSCDNDLKIYEMDRIVWELGKKNKTYRRVL